MASQRGARPQGVSQLYLLPPYICSSCSFLKTIQVYCSRCVHGWDIFFSFQNKRAFVLPSLLQLLKLLHPSARSFGSLTHAWFDWDQSTDRSGLVRCTLTRAGLIFVLFFCDMLKAKTSLLQLD